MRVDQTFRVARPPEAVFDYMTDPAHLCDWQTVKTSAEQVTPGPRGVGTRIRERTKPPVGREFEQIVEFSEFDRPRRFATHIVEGPAKIDGLWTFAPDGDGTRVHFVAEGPLPGPLRLLEPLGRRVLGRQFAGYHENLRRNLETG
jgi:carbon monoxide dehydrogenase subunit G